MLHDAEQPVFLIVNRYPVHRVAKLKKSAAATGGELEFCYSPAYAPNSILVKVFKIRLSIMSSVDDSLMDSINFVN